jgi:hypothetical protein
MTIVNYEKFNNEWKRKKYIINRKVFIEETACEAQH